MSDTTAILKFKPEAICKNQYTAPAKPIIKLCQHILQIVMISLVIVIGISSLSCAENSTTKTKSSSVLLGLGSVLVV
jgi:hypothetical protein